MDPLLLINKNVNTPEVKNFLNELEGPPDEDDFADFHVIDFPRSGLGVYVRPTGQIRTVFLYGEKNIEHSRYGGPLPLGLAWSDTMATIQEKVGQVETSGVSKRSGRPWLRFDMGHALFHVEFASASGPPTLLTIMGKPEVEEV